MPNEIVGRYWIPAAQDERVFDSNQLSFVIPPEVESLRDSRIALAEHQARRDARNAAEARQATRAVNATFNSFIEEMTCEFTMNSPTPSPVLQARDMPVYLPEMSFAASADNLSSKDLARNIINAARILRTLKRLEYSESRVNRHRRAKWLKMWLGHEGALAAYGLLMLDSLSVKNTSNRTRLQRLVDFFNSEWTDSMTRNRNDNAKPEWVYRSNIMESHRRALTYSQELDNAHAYFNAARRGAKRSGGRIRIDESLATATNLNEFCRQCIGCSLNNLTANRLQRLRDYLKNCVLSGRSSISRANTYVELYGLTPSPQVIFPGE